MRKRMILALCLAFVLLIGAIPAMAAGSVNAWLSADSTSVNAGNTVTVTVSAEVDNCGSGGIEIAFDSSVFTLTDGKCTIDDTDMDDFSVSAQDGIFAFDGTSPISGSAFWFTLKVKDGAPAGSYNVTVTFIADGTPVSRSISITVACDHTYDNGCDETCNRCGGTREVSHQYDGGKVTAAATCAKEGVKTYTCTSCGKTKTEPVSKTAHSWDGGKVIKEATCTQEGEKSYTCSACGTTKTEETGTLDHDYEIVEYVDATCTENGGISFECVNCGYAYDDYIEAGGHTYDNDCDEACNVCEETREVEHVYAAEDEEIRWHSDRNGHWQECKNCQQPQEPIPHNPGPEATETEDQKCLDCGYILKAGGTHTHKASGNFLGNDEKHWFFCACGELMGENDHQWSDQGIRDGQHVYKCLVCSRTKSEPVETTAPTEETTAPTEETTVPPTQPSTEATAPVHTPIDHVGIRVDWWWVIPVALIFLFVFGVGVYTIIGWIVGVGKKGKFDSKKRN